MKNYCRVLKNTELFKDMEEENILSMLKCLNYKLLEFEKNEVIIMVESKINNIGIVIDGIVQVLREEDDGSRSILTELASGEIFAEAFVCAGLNYSPVTVIAKDKCEVMFVDYNRIISTCPSACPFHTKLIENMVRLIAKKNLALSLKMEILSKRSTREKLLAYLSSQSQKNHSKRFLIPFTRDELADYLSVNRSALSRELSNMQDDQILKYKKNSFELL